VVRPRGLGLINRPLPPPPQRLRRGPLRPGAFGSPLRSERLTSQLGLWLGIAFGICFITGLTSHLIQHPPGWWYWPSRPAGLYRVTQGVHVATGLATVPLVTAKLWSVHPKLFTWPPVRSLVHALERASIAVLIAAALFQIVTGLLDVGLWYTPMPFFFTTAHYWTAWLAIGALLLHIAVQLPVIRRALGGDHPADAPADGLSRRGLLTAVAASAGVITVATVGETVAPLAPVSLLAPRRPGLGPQSLQVNGSAVASGVRMAASDPAYRLRLTGPSGTRMLSLADLATLPQTTASLPITCVEGWSSDAVWTGVRMTDLLHLVGGANGDDQVLVESLQTGGRYRTSVLDPSHIHDPLTLLALRLHGAALNLDHGYPARLIAPNRPGVMQTKWVGAVTVLPR
jgi:DMSO/TMAO reductase YedYZ molybdopterin-dependent catalytic subunit